MARVNRAAGQHKATVAADNLVGHRNWAGNLEGRGQEAVAGYAGHAALNAIAVAAEGRRRAEVGAEDME